MKAIADPAQARGMSRVLSGQDISVFRSNFPEGHESEIASKAVIAWPLTRCEERNDACSPMKLGSENWIQMGRSEPTYTDMLSGFRKSSDSHRLGLPCYERNSGDKRSSDCPLGNPEDELSLHGHWSLMSSNCSFGLEPNLKTATQAVQYGGIGGYSSLQNLGVEQNHSKFTSFPANTGLENLVQPQVVRPQPVVPVPGNVTMIGNNSSWKIFGFNLNSNPLPSGKDGGHSNANYELELCGQQTAILNKSSEVIEGRQCIESFKSTKAAESASTGSERDKGLQPSSQGARDVPSKPLGGSTRSCTKVLFSCLKGIS